MKRLITAALLLTSMTGCAWFTERSTGLVAGELTPCPSPPRCVSSASAEQEKQVPSLQLKVAGDEAWPVIAEEVAAMPRSKIISQTETYIHAEITSPWHVYTDDLELRLRANEGRVEIRSSGRIGYYDFNVNRDRVEALRAKLVARGVVSPTQ